MQPLGRLLAAEGCALSAPAAAALRSVLRLQGWSPCGPNGRGLHPLVVPLAGSEGPGPVLGLLRWPLRSGSLQLVEAQRFEGRGAAEHYGLRPCGSPVQFVRRAAAEADAAEADAGEGVAAELMAAAAVAAQELGGVPYVAGEFAASGRELDQFLLLKIGPFLDVWGSLARRRLATGDTTSALAAGERAVATNAGWGRGHMLQAQLMSSLGRHEERRDLALAALEAPFWSLGVTLSAAQEAAELSHVTDLRQLMRSMEEKMRRRHKSDVPSLQELAEQEALDALDEVVRTRGSWDEARPAVADALHRAGLTDAAAVVTSGRT